MAFAPAPIWSDEDLKAARDEGERRARERRRNSDPQVFADTYRRLEPQVRHGLEVSNNLRDLSGDIFREDPTGWEMFRYVCAPPISQEDYWTLVGGPKFKRVPEALADEAASAFADVADKVRFPWLAESREPTTNELEAAVLATTSLWAAQQFGTDARTVSSQRQESAVGAALQTAGLTFDPSRARADFLDAMDRGTYSRERQLGDSKCDVPARLHDGRLLAIECKVNNGPKNGWKRVNREVGGKARSWSADFGNRLLTAVVIDGVFDFRSLKTAQDNGVLIFWEYDLSPLAEFVGEAVTA